MSAEAKQTVPEISQEIGFQDAINNLVEITKGKKGFFADRDVVELPFLITTDKNDPLGPTYRIFITCEEFIRNNNLRVQLEIYMKDGHMSSTSAIFIPRAKNRRIDWDKITLTETTGDDNSSQTRTYKKDSNDPNVIIVRDKVKLSGKKPEVKTYREPLGKYISQITLAAVEIQRALSMLEI